MDNSVILAIVIVILVVLLLERAIKFLLLLAAAIVILHILGYQIPGLEDMLAKLDQALGDVQVLSLLNQLVDLISKLIDKIQAIGGV